MEDLILIFLAIMAIGTIVYYIEKEEYKEHNDEGIDNPYHQKPFHRTIKTHKNKLKNI